MTGRKLFELVSKSEQLGLSSTTYLLILISSQCSIEVKHSLSNDQFSRTTGRTTDKLEETLGGPEKWLGKAGSLSYLTLL